MLSTGTDTVQTKQTKTTFSASISVNMFAFFAVKQVVGCSLEIDHSFQAKVVSLF